EVEEIPRVRDVARHDHEILPRRDDGPGRAPGADPPPVAEDDLERAGQVHVQSERRSRRRRASGGREDRRKPTHKADEQHTAAPHAIAAALLLLVLAAPAPRAIHVVDTGLCGFKLVADVSGTPGTGTEGTPLEVRGPTTIRLRNAETGRTADLHTTGRTWLGAETRLPFLTSRADGSH